MSLILAVEPDTRQASQVAAVLRDRLEAELVIAQSSSQALDLLGGRVPDLLLTSALLSLQDESALARHLRALGDRAAHVQTLTIPILAAAGNARPRRRGVLSVLRRRGRASAATPGGCEPDVFADQVALYLQRAAELVATPRSDIAPEPVAIVACERAAPPVLEVIIALAPELEAREPEVIVAAPEPVLEPRPIACGAGPTIEEAPEPVALVECEPAAPEVPEVIIALAPELEAREPEVIVAAPEIVLAPEPEPEPEPVPVAGPEPVLVAPLPIACGAGLVRSAGEPDPPSHSVGEARPTIEEATPGPQTILPWLSSMLALLVRRPPPVQEVQPEVAQAVPVVEDDPAAVVADDDAVWVDVPLDELRVLPQFTAPPEPEPPVSAEPIWLLGEIPSDAAVTIRIRPPMPAPPSDVERAPLPPAPAVEMASAPPPPEPEPQVVTKVSTTTGTKTGTRRKAPRAKNTRPMQDEWGFFDPDQCGFGALLDKLDEVTDGGVETRKDTAVRVVTY